LTGRAEPGRGGERRRVPLTASATVCIAAHPVWKGAEDLGFHAAYTYDHLSWRVPFRDRIWFGAIPTLTAASGITDPIRPGTSSRRSSRVHLSRHDLVFPYRWWMRRAEAVY
jgi:alkanesulfonate monooxygenase SsuD/methylene tetrahydromethanopterin reductase-like flavin-dependent oxidoreductase (luciferase family)